MKKLILIHLKRVCVCRGGGGGGGGGGAGGEDIRFKVLFMTGMNHEFY